MSLTSTTPCSKCGIYHETTCCPIQPLEPVKITYWPSPPSLSLDQQILDELKAIRALLERMR